MRSARPLPMLLGWLLLLCGAVLCWLGTAQTTGGLAQIRAAAALDGAVGLRPDARHVAQEIARAEYRLADDWWPEPEDALELGKLDLAAGTAPDGNRTEVASARSSFGRSLAQAPGSAAAWFWLAEAGFVERGAGRPVIDALFRSISRARVDPALLAWRCELGLSLYGSLTDAEKQVLADQIRLLAQFSLDNLVRVARASRLMPIVVAALVPDPRALARFANRLQYLK